MQLLLKHNLPFITAIISHNGNTIKIPDILIDTGSASTIFASDQLLALGITPSPEDVLHTIRGVGGTEVVYLRQVDSLRIGERTVHNFEMEVGGMDYGFDINGILGMDFLTQSGAIINLQEMRVDFIL